MQEQRGRTPNHYETLGIPPEAPGRAIEEAFWRWREEFRRAAVGEAAFRGAESAYRALSDPGQRARHDRRIGLVPHPAWSEPAAASARGRQEAALRALARGRLPTARRLLAEAARSRPGDPAARSYLALALARSRTSLHEAARHGEYAVRGCPGEPAFRFNLAAVYAEAGLSSRAAGLRAIAWALLFAQAVGLRRCARRCAAAGRAGQTDPAGVAKGVAGKRTICMKCSR